MKKLIASLIILPLSFALSVSANPGSCTSQHSCNGCTTSFTQNSTSWSYTVDCGSGDPDTFNGSGDYEGTFCGG